MQLFTDYYNGQQNRTDCVIGRRLGLANVSRLFPPLYLIDYFGNQRIPDKGCRLAQLKHIEVAFAKLRNVYFRWLKFILRLEKN